MSFYTIATESQKFDSDGENTVEDLEQYMVDQQELTELYSDLDEATDNLNTAFEEMDHFDNVMDITLSSESEDPSVLELANLSLEHIRDTLGYPEEDEFFSMEKKKEKNIFQKIWAAIKRAFNAVVEFVMGIINKVRGTSKVIVNSLNDIHKKATKLSGSPKDKAISNESLAKQFGSFYKGDIDKGAFDALEESQAANIEGLVGLSTALTTTVNTYIKGAKTSSDVGNDKEALNSIFNNVAKMIKDAFKGKSTIKTVDNVDTVTLEHVAYGVGYNIEGQFKKGKLSLTVNKIEGSNKKFQIMKSGDIATAAIMCRKSYITAVGEVGKADAQIKAAKGFIKEIDKNASKYGSDKGAQKVIEAEAASLNSYIGAFGKMSKAPTSLALLAVKALKFNIANYKGEK